MLKIEDNELVVRLRLDRRVDERAAAQLTKLMAEEMAFADPEAGRYTKSGWGIGRARVIAVTCPPRIRHWQSVLTHLRAEIEPRQARLLARPEGRVHRRMGPDDQAADELRGD